MVAFVIVSHSAKLAEGVIDLARMSAPEVPMFAAGGLPDGSYGTSFEKITDAAGEAVMASGGDGVVILPDLGSAVMTAEMVLESLDFPNVKLADAPIVEAAVTGTVLSAAGSSLDEIMEEMKNCRG